MSLIPRKSSRMGMGSGISGRGKGSRGEGGGGANMSLYIKNIITNYTVVVFFYCNSARLFC